MGLPILQMIIQSHVLTRENSLAKQFLEFIESEKVETMKKDEWETVHYFFKKHTSLDNFDEMDAWPVIFDKFANNYK